MIANPAMDLANVDINYAANYSTLFDIFAYIHIVYVV